MCCLPFLEMRFTCVYNDRSTPIYFAEDTDSSMQLWILVNTVKTPPSQNTPNWMPIFRNLVKTHPLLNIVYCCHCFIMCLIVMDIIVEVTKYNCVICFFKCNYIGQIRMAEKKLFYLFCQYFLLLHYYCYFLLINVSL